MSDKFSRRHFLKGLAGVTGATILAACAPRVPFDTKLPATDSDVPAEPAESLPDTPFGNADLYDVQPTANSSDYPITPVEQIQTTGIPVDIDVEGYRLVVDGAVGEALSLPYNEILAFPSVTEGVITVCPGFFVNNATWTGVPLRDVLGRSGIDATANKVRIKSVSGYQTTMTLEDAMQEGTFLAYAVNGQELPAKIGFPLRLAVKGVYGAKWVKWIERIEVLGR